MLPCNTSRCYSMGQGAGRMNIEYRISNYECRSIISPERMNNNKQNPFILMIHIPMYAPGGPIDYGCGYPFWSAELDRLYELERRERWTEEGHTKVTMDFYDEVFSSDNLLGIFPVHIHRQSIDIVRRNPQFEAGTNATDTYLEINFLPISIAST